ncbi:MAG TPA: DUF1614 domain-containing protein [Candidatus Methylomirabilis sp.]|nr:DUF1614 domain-containing protein [Candidatus Methylomirabilis sp.]
MIYVPFPLPVILLLGLLFALLVILIEMRVLAYAYKKIGVRPRYVFAVMVLSLLGSQVDIPLYSVPARHIVQPPPSWRYSWQSGRAGVTRVRITVVAINVGGALIPMLVSLYLFVRMRMPARMVVGTVVVAIVVHQMAEIVPGAGIVVPMLVPPLVAAGVALLLAYRRAPPLAYVAGSMGTLLGADVMNLSEVGRLGSAVVSIGGAGTFDGVFLTGIIAGLLA